MGSGFMAHAIESLKSNRKRLHEKTNRFRQRQVYKRLNKRNTKRKRGTENTWKLKLAEKKRRNKIRKQIGFIAFIAIIGTIVLLQLGNKFIGKQLIIYQTDIRNIELSAANASRKEGYFTLIKKGDYYLDNENWQVAQNIFNNALNLYPNGKRANLGLTKCLIYRCKQEQKYCEEALNYFNHLNQSGIYSDVTMNNLTLLIQD